MKRQILLIILGAAALIGAGTHRVKSSLDARRFPPPGQFVDVGDHRLHMHCEGAGAPTVMLEAGAGGWSLGMRRLHRALRDSLRVCSYDRASLGWSDASKGGFDIASSVADLHTLVDSARIARPFVLVGHSLGANIAQLYAATHRDDLAAVVLLDPGTPDDMAEDFDGTDMDAMAIDACGWKCGLTSSFAHLGVVRFAAQWAGSTRLTDEENRMYRATVSHPRTARALIGTMVYVPKSGVQTRSASNFGDLPVTVFYSGNTREKTGKETESDVAAWHALKLDQMRQLLAGTSNPRGPIVIPGVTHLSMILDSASVVVISHEVVQSARRH